LNKVIVLPLDDNTLMVGIGKFLLLVTYSPGFLGDTGGALGGAGGALGGAGGSFGAAPDADAPGGGGILGALKPHFTHCSLVIRFFVRHFGHSASGTNPQFGQTVSGSIIVSHCGQGSFPGSSFAPHSTQTVAIGLLTLPHL